MERVHCVCRYPKERNIKMSQITEHFNELTRDAASPGPVQGKIVQGDGTSRFSLIGEEGSALALADEIYCRYHLAEPICKIIEADSERRQALVTETERLFAIIKAWMDEHKGRVDTNKTKLPKPVLVSSSGKVRFQFIVILLKGELEDFCVWENDLAALDEKVLHDPFFQIVRLDSLCM